MMKNIKQEKAFLPNTLWRGGKLFASHALAP